jgi:hypothetical protein
MTTYPINFTLNPSIQNRSGKNWKLNNKTGQQIASGKTPVNMRPAVNKFAGLKYDGNNFRARPMKHWRKQYSNVNPSAIGGSTLPKNLLHYTDTPGGTTISNSLESQCLDCSYNIIVPDELVAFRSKDTLNNKVGEYYPSSFAQMINYNNPKSELSGDYAQCLYICDPQKNAQNKVRYPSAVNTNKSKPKYYQSNSSYLQSKCATFKQNQGNVAHCNSSCSVYKPNNAQYSQQGAVSSSSRIDRLKYNTINKFASNFTKDVNFGPSVANAYAYSGRPEAPFTIKNKMSNCKSNISQYHINGNKNLNC